MSFKENLAKATGLPERILPGSYQIIGDVLLLKFMKIKSLQQKRKIAIAIMDLLPYVKTACEITKVEKEFRTPKIRKLAGNGTVTTHKEHGILYKLDAAKIMFSKGNLFERQRLINQVKRDEVIVDMFAGIGYFSLGLAKNAKKVFAIEKNPVAFNYLKENIRLNRVNNIYPILGDNREIAEKLREKADRIIMGYFPRTDRFIPSALIMLKKDGIIHFHNTYREDELWKKPLDEIEKACIKSGFTFKVIGKKKVKSIAPRVWHVVIDLKITKI
jgi:tRNA wybutosine-synthesizing protein 2